MKRETSKREGYITPRITTVPAATLVEALGPVSAGSNSRPCGPMLGNYCP